MTRSRRHPPTSSAGGLDRDIAVRAAQERERMAPEARRVIALISGGKDSFYSVLQCIRNGHRVVALANLCPATSAVIDVIETEVFDPVSSPREMALETGHGSGEDLNSFMYQTVGHQVIPLYAAATGLPLYRRAIAGKAIQTARDYDGNTAAGATRDSESDGPDEAESMTDLLRTVMAHHPDADAVCAGAILSTYQRTRVESVALRLGLQPLAFLWKFQTLPGPDGQVADESQLLYDMFAADLDARIIKVASAGLDEDFLWMRVSLAAGVQRMKRALRRFGDASASVLGEGGEFESLVVDGPRELFRGRVVVPDGATTVVREGGGSSWLNLSRAVVEPKTSDATRNDEIAVNVRVPPLLDRKFEDILESVQSGTQTIVMSPTIAGSMPLDKLTSVATHSRYKKLDTETDELHMAFSSFGSGNGTSMAEITEALVDDIRRQIGGLNKTTSATSVTQLLGSVTNTVVLLRRMADFPTVNNIYATLFPLPNPPARVTISCGDQLPDGCDLVIGLTLRLGLAPTHRNGLHVQSVSYWAPANIGPYSQAIDVPLPGKESASDVDDQDGESTSGARLVTIAGQIPLIPSSMALPGSDSPSMTPLQTVLSLQHLWRIGIDRQVQLWTSAVAYLSRGESQGQVAQRAMAAARAWEAAHREPQSEEDEEDDFGTGPDLWDQRYNPQFSTLGGGVSAQGENETSLPSWDVFSASSERRMPPFFAAEVEELPRGAEIEWHAHAGFSGLDPGSIERGKSSGTIPTSDGQHISWNIDHLLVRSGRKRLLHGTVSFSRAERFPGVEEIRVLIQRVWRQSLEDLVEDLPDGPNGDGVPYMIYIANEGADISGISSNGLTIPCRSLWSASGNQQWGVGLFRVSLM